MKRMAPIATLSIGVLALMGCGSGESDQDRIDELEAQVEELEAGESVYEIDEDADPILDEYDFNGQMTEDVEAPMGEAVPIDVGPFVNNGYYMGTMALTGVSYQTECSWGDEHFVSTNGQFLYATFEIEVDEEYEEEFLPNDGEFTWVGFEDYISSYDTFGCMEEVNGFQEDIRPGESDEVTLVFDVPDTKGSLEYQEATYYVEWAIDGEGAVEAPVDEGSVQEPEEEPATEASEEDLTEDAEMPEWESDGGYVSRAEAEDAAIEGECPVGERNLDPDGLDCQPLSMSFDRYAEENGITFDEPEAEEPEYEDPESCSVLLYNVQTAGKRLEQTLEGSAEHDAVLEEFLSARDEAEAAGC